MASNHGGPGPPVAKSSTEMKKSNTEMKKSSIEMKADRGDEMIMAGPMVKWDGLHIWTFMLSAFMCATTGMGTFGISSVIVEDERMGKEDIGTAIINLGDCTDSLLLKETDSISVACIGKVRGVDQLGGWISMAKIFALMSVACSALVFLMEILNMIKNPRNKLVHMCAHVFAILSGIAMLIAGHIGHNQAVWDEQKRNNQTLLRVTGAVPGLFLVGTLFAAWFCVLNHVSSHGPGPVSYNTRFQHIYSIKAQAEQMPVAPPTMLEMEEEEYVPDYRIPSAVEVQERRESVHSTAV